MGTWEDTLAELEESGMDSDTLTKIKEAADGSPLRKELKRVREQNEQYQTQLKSFQGDKLASTLKDLGFRGKASALAVPSDLDVLNPDAIKTWAVEQELIDSKPDTDPEELATHDRISDATAGTEAPETGTLTPANVADWPKDKMRRFMKEQPEAWEALKRGEEVRGLNV